MSGCNLNHPDFALCKSQTKRLRLGYCTVSDSTYTIVTKQLKRKTKNSLPWRERASSQSWWKLTQVHRNFNSPILTDASCIMLLLLIVASFLSLHLRWNEPVLHLILVKQVRSRASCNKNFLIFTPNCARTLAMLQTDNAELVYNSSN